MLLATPVSSAPSTRSAPFASSTTRTHAEDSAGSSHSAQSIPHIPQLLKVRDYVDADILSERDQNSEDPGRMPYPDTLEHLPHLSQLQSDDFFTLHPMTTPRQPKPPSLHRQLQSLVDQDPTPPLDSLIRFHASFPARKQSTRSYNLLLRLAIRNASYRTVTYLLETMREMDIPGDEHTLKYTVRFLVRQGLWSDAFTVATGRGSRGMANTAFGLGGVHPIAWAELFGGAQRGAVRRGFEELGSRPVTPQTHGIGSEQFHLNMRQLPKLTLTNRSVDRPSKTTIYLFVQSLLRMGEHRAALDITIRLLRANPTVWGMRFIHLHIALLGRKPMPKPGIQRYNAARRDLDAMLSACPSLQPDATTLFILLGHLKSTVNCGILGHRLLLQFESRWGKDVVNASVRARMLALARKQGQPDLIQTCLDAVRRSGDLKGTRHGELPEPSTSRTATATRTERAGGPLRSMYLRKGAERTRSWKLVGRVGRRKASHSVPTL